MSASRASIAAWKPAAASLLLIVACLVAAQDVRAADERVGATEAIEKARALERDGHAEDAYVYLYQFTTDNEDLARDASILLEISRLSPDAEESVDLLEQAVEAARDAATASSAREMLGDYLYARGSYLEAAEQYGAAAERAPDRDEEAILLKRAASMLAAGDAMAAERAYRDIKGRGSAPSEATAWAMLGLGRALVARGELAEAADEFETLADAYPEHEARPQALAGAAGARVALGQTATARLSLETLVAEYGTTYEAVLAREDLHSLPADTASVAESTPDSLEQRTPEGGPTRGAGAGSE